MCTIVDVSGIYANGVGGIVNCSVVFVVCSVGAKGVACTRIPKKDGMERNATTNAVDQRSEKGKRTPPYIESSTVVLDTIVLVL